MERFMRILCKRFHVLSFFSHTLEAHVEIKAVFTLEHRIFF